MSILRGLGRLTGAVIRTGVALPLAVAKNVVTLGGAFTHDGSMRGPRTATARQIRKITNDFDGGIRRAIAATRRTTDKEFCVISAIQRGPTGEIVTGHRHADCILKLMKYGLARDRGPEVQGFMTSLGRFVTREEGRKLQDAAGIPSVADNGYRPGTLYSEDLY